MIIGITGKNCSGKGELAAYLKTAGYTYYSLSDEIRDELKKNNIPESRESLIEMGNKLRSQYGPSALADMLIKKIEPGKNYVIDSIRNPAEVMVLKKLPNFTLVEVRADDKIRYERMQSRNRQGDAHSFEEFIAQEKREMNNENSTMQQLDKTIKMADVVLENNEDLEEFQNKINKLTSDLQ